MPRKQGPFPCGYCDHISTDEAECRRHRRTHPKAERVLTCSTCGHQTKNHAGAFGRHVWAHESAESRFWERVEKSDGCWLWKGARNSHLGYGRLRVMDKLTLAHVYAYELTHGTVPDGLELDHLCRNVMCVRPDHLEPVTHAVNMQRGLNGMTKAERMAHQSQGVADEEGKT